MGKHPSEDPSGHSAYNQIYAAYPWIFASTIIAICMLVGACSSTQTVSQNGVSHSGSVDWSWNQIPQGGTDEKSSSAPVESSD